MRTSNLTHGASWRFLMPAFVLAGCLGVPRTAQASLRPLFDALREVESGGDNEAVGDGGRSLGPYQIQWRYWHDSGVPGSYRAVRNPAYAEKVMLAYWQRYCPDALARHDYAALARVHNGGPQGTRNSATLSYWRKVARELKK
jgi:hypothetical protein